MVFISLTSWLSSKWFFFLLFKAEDVSPCLRALEINMRHVGFEIHLRTPTCKRLCLIFLSGCREEMQSEMHPRCIRDPHQYSYQVILKLLKTEVIRNMLFSSSGFISLRPLNSQTVGQGKQPYRSPKVYRVSYFRSTWKNAWISAVEM